MEGHGNGQRTEIGHDQGPSGNQSRCGGCGRQFSSWKGMRIHQGRKKCGQNAQAQRSVLSGQSSVSQDPEHNHSVLARPGAKALPDRIFIKWPKSKDSAWKVMDEELSRAFNTHRGTACARAEKLAAMVSEYGIMMFGEKEKVGQDMKEKKEMKVNRRRRKIEELRKEVRKLRSRKRTCSEMEAESLDVLIRDHQKAISKLAKAERKLAKKAAIRKARKSFIEDPFRFTKKTLQEKASGTLTIPIGELEDALKVTYSDPDRNTEVHEVSGLFRPSVPLTEFDVSRIKLTEVQAVIHKARAKSAGGPNGVTYAVYKNCKKLTECLWKAVAKVWDSGEIPESWAVADGIYIPKEDKATTLNQFRPISLLNVEGKVFFSVLAKRLTSFLLSNSYVETSIQKAGIPGFPGCLEHVSTIWSRLKQAKAERGDLHVVWLDLANAYGSVPHRFIQFALELFHVPQKMNRFIDKYFSTFQFRFSIPSGVTNLCRLEKGIAMGCAISPILFVMVMEMIIRSSGSCDNMKAFMDDLTLIESQADQVTRMLNRLIELVSWCGMKFKPQKSRSLSLLKGKMVSIPFTLEGVRIPTVRETGVKSLGRWYSFPLTDRHRGVELQELALKFLQRIDKTALPGRFKIWMVQFGILPRLLWPITIYEITLSRIEIIEAKISAMVRKWLGVPRMLTTIALYGKTNKLSLPLTSLIEEYKVSKVRLQSMLCSSRDKKISSNPPTINVGRKWNVTEVLHSVNGMAKHEEVVGVIQNSRRGLGMEKRCKFVSEVSVGGSQHRKLQEAGVRSLQEEERLVQAAQQGQQGRWLNWEVEDRRLTWSDIWSTEFGRLKRQLQLTYDVFPTPANLTRWGIRSNPCCHLCGAYANLSHILSGCRVALQKGWYTYRHNVVLQVMVEAVTEASIPVKKPMKIDFVTSGQSVKRKPAIAPPVSRKWTVRVDKELPEELSLTDQRPDLVLIDMKEKRMIVGELTVPWEENIEEAHERKASKYEEVVDHVRNLGWECSLTPFEVGCRGFVAPSVRTFLRKAGVKNVKKIIKKLSAKAEEGSSFVLRTWARQAVADPPS